MFASDVKPAASSRVEVEKFAGVAVLKSATPVLSGMSVMNVASPVAVVAVPAG